jgi:hypothetical protein
MSSMGNYDVWSILLRHKQRNSRQTYYFMISVNHVLCSVRQRENRVLLYRYVARWKLWESQVELRKKPDWGITRHCMYLACLPGRHWSYRWNNWRVHREFLHCASVGYASRGIGVFVRVKQSSLCVFPPMKDAVLQNTDVPSCEQIFLKTSPCVRSRYVQLSD